MVQDGRKGRHAGHRESNYISFHFRWNRCIYIEENGMRLEFKPDERVVEGIYQYMLYACPI